MEIITRYIYQIRAARCVSASYLQMDQKQISLLLILRKSKYHKNTLAKTNDDNLSEKKGELFILSRVVTSCNEVATQLKGKINYSKPGKCSEAEEENVTMQYWRSADGGQVQFSGLVFDVVVAFS